MNEDDESVENAMSLSFLDVISCGMVSSIFLAIIFSVIGYKPAISLRTEEFIAVILEVNYEPDSANADNASDESANDDSADAADGVDNKKKDDNGDCQVWNIALKRPGKSSQKYERLDMSSFNLSTGRYVEKDVENEDNINLKIQLFGFNSLFYNGKSAGKYRIFFISKPEHGKWELLIYPKDDSTTNPELKLLKNIKIISSNKSDVQEYDYEHPEKCGKDVKWEPDEDSMKCTFEF